MQRVELEYQGNSIDLPVGETVVGRDMDCTLRLNDPAVSRRHLRLIRRQEEVFVEDLGSSNGTLVNGHKIVAAVRIFDGDILGLATRTLTIRILEGGDYARASTLLLSKLNASEQKMKTSRPTTQLAATVPPPMIGNQRCPKCGAVVSEADDECAKCKFQWGSFRPMSHTDVRPNPLNRRRHDRMPIELHLVYSSDELEIETISRDLSASGVMVCSQVLDPVGTHCQLTILVDGGPPFGVRGIVRRVLEHETDGEPIGLGVEFIDIGEAELGWIKSAIAQTAVDDE